MAVTLEAGNRATAQGRLTHYSALPFSQKEDHKLMQRFRGTGKKAHGKTSSLGTDIGGTEDQKPLGGGKLGPECFF